MVLVIFASAKRLELPKGMAALRLNPGVEVYDADGNVMFGSTLEVISVSVDGRAI